MPDGGLRTVGTERGPYKATAHVKRLVIRMLRDGYPTQVIARACRLSRSHLYRLMQAWSEEDEEFTYPPKGDAR